MPQTIARRGDYHHDDGRGATVSGHAVAGHAVCGIRLSVMTRGAA